MLQTGKKDRRILMDDVIMGSRDRVISGETLGQRKRREGGGEDPDILPEK